MMDGIGADVYPKLTGSPILNTSGEVVGMHIGRAQHANGQVFGTGIPAAAIQKQIGTLAGEMGNLAKLPLPRRPFSR